MAKNRKPKLDVGEIYSALSLVIAEAMNAEQIWRYLISPQTHEEYGTQLGIYIPFFNGVRQSTFTTTILVLAKFSDSQSNALNVSVLFESIRASGAEEIEIEKADEKYKSCEHIWQKIKIIRHNVLAHTSASIGEDDAFTMADITPNEVSHAVKTAHEILIDMGKFFGGPALELAFDPKSTTRDISKLFKNLKAGRDARLKQMHNK